MSKPSYNDNGNLPPGWQERERLITFTVKPDAFYERLREEREEERRQRYGLDKNGFENNYHQDR